MEQILITVVQGDSLYDINFALTDSTGAILNLTGSTLVFKAQSISNPAVQTDGAMAIVSAVAGTCKYTVQATDFPVPGNYNAQVVVTFTGPDEVITFSDILITVETRLPGNP